MCVCVCDSALVVRQQLALSPFFANSHCFCKLLSNVHWALWLPSCTLVNEGFAFSLTPSRLATEALKVGQV